MKNWGDIALLNGNNYASDDRDAAGNGFHTGGSAWEPPSLVEVGIDDGFNADGFRALRFNGNTQAVLSQFKGHVSPAINDQELTLFAVYRPRGAGILCGGRYGEVNQGWNGWYGMNWFTGVTDNDGLKHYGLTRVDSVGRSIRSEVVAPIGEFVILKFVLHGYTGEKWQATVIGSDGLTSTSAEGNLVESPLRDIRTEDSRYPARHITSLAIGRSDTSPGGWIDGDIAELMLFNGVQGLAGRCWTGKGHR